MAGAPYVVAVLRVEASVWGTPKRFLEVGLAAVVGRKDTPSRPAHTARIVSWC